MELKSIYFVANLSPTVTTTLVITLSTKEIATGKTISSMSAEIAVSWVTWKLALIRFEIALEPKVSLELTLTLNR